MYWLKTLLVFIQYQLTLGQLSTNREELKNWCLKGKYHKAKPGPEDKLHEQCSPWKNYSCCSYNDSVQIHTEELRYRFTRNHCQKLSEECERHFIQDLCFYECEPNLGPWMVKIDMKLRKERFVNVPLCASDCDQWFAACANDFTCAENWMTGFRRENGTNVCARGQSCRKFTDVFKNATNFCQKVWDSSWKYTPNDQPCMRLWFDGKAGNPNERVADIRIDQLLAGNSSCPLLLPLLNLILLALISNGFNKYFYESS